MNNKSNSRSPINTYKHQFLSAQSAARYDETEYGESSYSQILWELEKKVIRDIVDELRQTQEQIRYLDFASGTGRVAAFVEGLVDCATAVDVSESMLSRARQRLRRTTVLCRDITTDPNRAEERYDLITAFRFFLNAEPALRQVAMRALAARLRDDSSVLVFNNHGNLWSLKMLKWPYHLLLRAGQHGWQAKYLRYSQIEHLLESAGLRIVRVVRLGVLSGTIAGRLSFERALRLEKWFAAKPLCSRFGQDEVYLASRIPK